MKTTEQTTRALAVGYYTPTPAFRSTPEMVAVFSDPDGIGVGPLIATFGPTGDAESEADARLFTAASDLLEALQAAAAYTELFTGNGVREQPPEWARLPNGDFDAEEIARRARAAIAKATGGEQ